MAVPMTKADAIARFNALVRDQITPNLGSAPAYLGFVPSSPSPAVTNHADLWTRPEPAKTTGEITLNSADAGTQVANSIFNLMHNFAMTYTRVRQAKWIYIVGTTATEGVAGLTSLKPQLALYFDLPVSELPPVTGENVDADRFDDFLKALRVQVNLIRNDSQYMHVFGACHTSCHGSCHGSRGRR